MPASFANRPVSLRVYLSIANRNRATSMEEIAVRENFTANYLARFLPLAFLAPDIVQAIVEGRQPVEMTIASLTRGKPLPLNWADQRRMPQFA